MKRNVLILILVTGLLVQISCDDDSLNPVDFTDKVDTLWLTELLTFSRDGESQESISPYNGCVTTYITDTMTGHQYPVEEHLTGRTLIKIPEITVDNIDSLIFDFYVLRAVGGYQSFKVHNVTDLWFKDSVTWANQPDYTPTDDTLVLSLVDESRTAINITSYLDSETAAYGILLRYSYDTECSFYNNFWAYSYTSTDSSKHPFVIVYYQGSI